jgi:aminoglycoside phosphotransferase (APT) family kinase protein
MPRLLHAAEDNPVTGHPYGLFEWIDGQRLEIVIADASDSAMAEMGRSIGVALAGIHAVTFSKTGFLDGRLSVETEVPVGGEGLRSFVRDCVVEGRGRTRLDADLVRRLLAYVDSVGGRLDAWDGPPCLSHSDFGGSNILVWRRRRGWSVAAVVDWEFAFSGSPFFDLGNLLRPPLGERPKFADAVRSGYLEAGGRLPDNWRYLSRLADLFAWVEFTNRERVSAALIDDARSAIERTLATPPA